MLTPAEETALRDELQRVTRNLRAVTDEAIERQSKLDQLKALCDEAERIEAQRTVDQFTYRPPVAVFVSQLRDILGGDE